MWKEKLGTYLIDISKYVMTGIVISSFFRDFGESWIFLYGFGVLVSIITLIVGLILIQFKKNK
jgi:hypothetical protein